MIPRSLSSSQDDVHVGGHISVDNKERLAAKLWIRDNMFMADFDHIKTNIKCTLFKQVCCTYYGATLQSVGNICIAGQKALRKSRGLALLTHVIISVIVG